MKMKERKVHSITLGVAMSIGMLIAATSYFFSAKAKESGEVLLPSKTLYSERVMYPTPGEITIGAATAIPQYLPLTRKAYEDVVDCGFNIMSQYATPEKYDSILPLIEGLNLRLAVSNSALNRKNNVEVVKKFKASKQLACWTFDDEPLFENLKTLSDYYHQLVKAQPDKLIFLNLIGAPIKQFIGNSPNYAAYLDTIEHYFQPMVWAYDLYPLSIKDGKVRVAHDIFYSDLEIVSKKARTTKRPFWVYCQGMEFKNSVVYRPAATIPYLRFEAFSALAYGAQGIIYWTYGQRYDGGTEHFLSALVSLKGEKTKAWYAARQVNSEIKAYNDVFYKCEFVDCQHTGAKVYQDTKKLIGKFGPLDRIESGDDGVLVSWLRNRGKDYLVIVNHNPLGKQTVRLTFNKNNEAIRLEMDKKTNNIQNIKTGIKEKIILPPGGYVVYEWRK